MVLHFEVAEVRRTLGAIADDDHFDLGHNEAVAAAMLAHAFVQVREAPQVFDFFVVAFDAHAGVPAVEGLDEPDDAA